MVNKRGSLVLSYDKNITEKKLPPEAERALAEAAERRTVQEARERELEAQRQAERGGPKQQEPTRYGDWERAGRAIDF